MSKTPNADRLISRQLMESATQPLGQAGLEAMRRIVADHQYEKINGVVVDAFSASAFVRVYDHLGEPKNQVMLTKPLYKVMEFVWKAIK